MVNIVRDLEECRLLWEKYSPRVSLWDDVDVVFSLFDEAKHNIFFIDLDPGLVPLWFDKIEKKYYFFGGFYPEARSLWFDESRLVEVYDLLPVPTILFDVRLSEFNIGKFDFVGDEDFRHFLNIKEIRSVDSYLATLSKKHKKNLRYDIDKVMSLGLVVKWGKIVNFDALKEFSISRFGEDSDFFDEVSQKETISFISAVKDYLFCVNLYLDNKLVGLMFAVFYNNIFYVINGNNDYGIKNLGKVLILECIKKAIELGAVEVDFLVGSSSWKDLWNFEKEKLFTIRKS